MIRFHGLIVEDEKSVYVCVLALSLSKTNKMCVFSYLLSYPFFFLSPILTPSSSVNSYPRWSRKLVFRSHSDAEIGLGSCSTACQRCVARL